MTQVVLRLMTKEHIDENSTLGQNGLVPSGKKSLPDPLLMKFIMPYVVTVPQMS